LSRQDADAVGSDDTEVSFACFPDDILLQFHVSRFSETGSEEVNEFDALAHCRFDYVDGLFDGRGDNGKIDGFRKVSDGRIGFNATHFGAAGVNGIERAGPFACRIRK
jgi:hypothetical protein